MGLLDAKMQKLVLGEARDMALLALQICCRRVGVHPAAHKGRLLLDGGNVTFRNAHAGPVDLWQQHCRGIGPALSYAAFA